jgi:hypothetical protein
VNGWLRTVVQSLCDAGRVRAKGPGKSAQNVLHEGSVLPGLVQVTERRVERATGDAGACASLDDRTRRILLDPRCIHMLAYYSQAELEITYRWDAGRLEPERHYHLYISSGSEVILKHAI